MGQTPKHCSLNQHQNGWLERWTGTRKDLHQLRSLCCVSQEQIKHFSNHKKVLSNFSSRAEDTRVAWSNKSHASLNSSIVHLGNTPLLIENRHGTGTLVALGGRLYLGTPPWGVKHVQYSRMILLGEAGRLHPSKQTPSLSSRLYRDIRNA